LKDFFHFIALIFKPFGSDSETKIVCVTWDFHGGVLHVHRINLHYFFLSHRPSSGIPEAKRVETFVFE
jgi:hypothetical protein